MITAPTTVKDKGGKETPAQVAKCSVCDGGTFHLFVVNGHNHIQCANPICGETYCQGGCEAPEPPKISNCPNCNRERELNGTGGHTCYFCGTSEGGEDPGKCPCGEDH